MCHHRLPPFAVCESKRVGYDKPNEKRLSTEDANSIVGCSSGFHADKRSEGKVSLPLCSLTIWYYHYALTLCITKPDPAYAWHMELNTSLGITTRNQPNRFVVRNHLSISEHQTRVHLLSTYQMINGMNNFVNIPDD